VPGKVFGKIITEGFVEQNDIPVEKVWCGK
jgi:hypothetical protein